MHRFASAFPLALLVSLAASTALATIRLVKSDGTGDYPTIQAAVDAAVDGDEVHLTEGAYQGEGNRDLRYHGKAITVRSETGDPKAVVINTQSSMKDPHRAFIFDEGEGVGSRLEHVTIWGQELLGYDDLAVIQCVGTSPTFDGCVFAYTFGTAVRSNGGTPTFEDCIFRDNHNVEWTPALAATAAVLRGCTFENNGNDDSAGAASIQRAFIYDCIFANNTTWGYAGSLSVGPGSVIEDTAIDGWAKFYGAAVVASGPVAFRRCTISEGSNGSSALHVGSGCVTLQDCSVASISPPGACVRRVESKSDPAAAEPLSTDVATWGQIKATYR